MARGQQKIQSQQKASEKAAKAKKQAGHSASDQKKAALAALKSSCVVCRSQMPDPKTYKQHFENKHPKNELPPELKEVVWSGTRKPTACAAASRMHVCARNTERRRRNAAAAAAGGSNSTFISYFFPSFIVFHSISWLHPMRLRMAFARPFNRIIIIKASRLKQFTFCVWNHSMKQFALSLSFEFWNQMLFCVCLCINDD